MTAPTETPATDAAAYDLTSNISPYLDLHMMFPLLEYIDSLISSGSISYNAMDVAQARLELLKPTHMVDYAMDIYREVHGADATIPKEMEEQKAGVFQKLEELKDGQAAFEELCRNEEARVSDLISLETNFCIFRVVKQALMHLLYNYVLYFEQTMHNRQISSVATSGTYSQSHPMQATVSQLKLSKTITNSPSSTLTVVTTNKDGT